MPSANEARGYGKAHRAERARVAAFVRSEQAVCARCLLPIGPPEEPCYRCGRVRCGGKSSNWDLGHDDTDRSVYTGPEHSCCNRRAGGRRGGRATARNHRVWSRSWLPD